MSEFCKECGAEITDAGMPCPVCGAVKQTPSMQPAGGVGARDPQPIVIPGLWDDWQVVRKLGQGSFGTVYEVSREDFGETVRSALKVISIPQNESDIESLVSEGMSLNEVSEYYTSVAKSILEEFKIMSQLRGNTNIVSYEDHKIVPRESGIGYDILIRMELLTSFYAYLQSRNNMIGRNEVLKLGVDMCRALELCEKMNIIHRDIKPENIFVNHLGDFKLGDFGVAREMEESFSTMSKKGTYSYMAPEVYIGKKYDATVDIYSLGIVLYRYFNGGRLPFVEPGKKMLSDYRNQCMMRRITGEKLPDPMNASKLESAVILKACAYEAKDRYQTAKDLREDLEALLSGKPALNLNKTAVPRQQPQQSMMQQRGMQQRGMQQNMYQQRQMQNIYQQRQQQVNTMQNQRQVQMNMAQPRSMQNQPMQNQRPMQQNMGQARPQNQPMQNQRPMQQNMGQARPQNQPMQNQRPMQQNMGQARPQNQPMQNQRPMQQNMGQARPQNQPMQNQRPMQQNIGQARQMAPGQQPAQRQMAPGQQPVQRQMPPAKKSNLPWIIMIVLGLIVIAGAVCYFLI